MKTEDELRKDYTDWLLESGEDLLTSGAKFRAWTAAYKFYGHKVAEKQKAVAKDPKINIIEKEENSNGSKKTIGKKENRPRKKQADKDPKQK